MTGMHKQLLTPILVLLAKHWVLQQCMPVLLAARKQLVWQKLWRKRAYATQHAVVTGKAMAVTSE